jgi:hypothetical protein
MAGAVYRHRRQLNRPGGIKVDFHARVLFSIAAFFNLVVGVVFLFAMPQLAAIIGMHPIPSDRLFMHLSAVLVLTFGWGYWRASIDPERNRPMIWMGIVGKSLVVVEGYADWFLNNTNAVFPMFLLADAIFAILFIDYLRRRPVARVTA